ncbi:hypothetical protein D3C72_1796680 [compost metagenome]
MPAHRIEQPFDEHAFIGRVKQQVQECLRRQQASFRMTPAKKRLGADDGGVSECYLRLEVKLELVRSKRLAKTGAQGNAVAHPPVKRRIIRAHLKPARGLRCVHGRIGMAQQFFG